MNFSLCKFGLIHYLTAPVPSQEAAEKIINGDCSSVVEPRIVIPVVAGSIPVSHPIFLFIIICHVMVSDRMTFNRIQLSIYGGT